ncbi:hypothetical protein GCM10027346_37860 [Hymenobacter seoulensis]
MAFAIIRVTKITSREQAISVAHHNYRTQETPNADPALRHLNQELVNHAQRSYWDLAGERIAELQLPRLRKDAIRIVEVLLTASEEKFPKDPATGRRADIRESPWVRDNLDFLQKRYGAENVIGCMLHQDESTPHLHALVVPVTQEPRLHQGERRGPAERLSARDLFSPAALRQLQTDYARAMAPYGLRRGVEYSTAIHQDVRRYYGAQKTSQRELAELTRPLVPTAIQLPALKALERVNPQAYLDREQARLNEHLVREVAAVNAKLAQVSAIATANTLAQERVRVLEKQLATSKERELQTAASLQQKSQELTATTQQLESVRQRLHQLVVRTAQGEPLTAQAREWATRQQEQSRRRAEQVVGDFLQGPVNDPRHLNQALQAKGYTVYHPPGEDQLLVREESTQVRFPLAALRPGGEDLVGQLQRALERTRQQEEQQRREKLAQEPGALQAVITARDQDQAHRIQAELEKAGANVWQVQAQEQGRVLLRVSYHFDWKTVEPISQVLERVQRSTGTSLEESYAHQATRTSAVRSMEREREPRDRSRGLAR